MIRKEAGLESSSRSYHKRIAKKTSVQFIGAVCAFELGYILLNLFFLIIMGITGLDTTFLFNAFKPFMIPVVLIISFIGCSYIAYRFMRKPLEYLDEVSEASKRLALCALAQKVSLLKCMLCCLNRIDAMPYPMFPVVSSMAMAAAIPLDMAAEETGGAETAGWGTRGRAGVS